MTEPRIVVLGGGFAGLRFVRKYRGPGHITIIDKENHHLFQPLLYQVASAALSATDIATPIRSVFQGRKNVSVVMDEVEELRLSEREVVCSRATLSYDYLVIALGGQTSYFGNDHWATHAPGLKTLEDALTIRSRMLANFELAETSSSTDERAKLMRMVIVGAGPTGVELAGSFADLTRKIFRRNFRNIQPEHSQILLVDGSERVLMPYSPKLSHSAQAQLEKLGVEVQLDTMVTDVEENRITLQRKGSDEKETLDAGLIVWGGGVAASSITQELATPKDRAGRLEVTANLSLPNHPEVFAVGDIAQVKSKNGTAVPGVAPAALQMGQYVAEYLQKKLKSQPLPPAFSYWDKGSLATIGRSKAVAQMGKVEVSGLFAWLSWLLIHLVFLIDFRNRLMTLIQWFFQYINFRAGARIIPTDQFTSRRRDSHLPPQGE
ncbi:MAG: NAD(P)/FAD-dependent oxidoreductase [Polyangiaceae bacterium]|nr:NAD(P)/FAD-dependent oxidoreductase [Polyangiaceae bacterium]